MRALSTTLFFGASVCLVAGGILFVVSLRPSPVPADIVAGLEVSPDAAPDIMNDAVLVLRNTGGRVIKLLNVPDG